MTKLGNRAWMTLVALAIVVSAACGGMRRGNDGATRIIVDNTLGPVGTVQVWVVPEVGIRSLIGNVGAAGVDTLTYNVPAGGGQYRLVAEPATGGQVVSQPITLTTAPTMIRWDLGQNAIFVTPP